MDVERVALRGQNLVVDICKVRRAYLATRFEPKREWNKPAIDYASSVGTERLVAELAIVRELRDAGWHAYWVSSNGLREQLPSVAPRLAVAQFVDTSPFRRFANVLLRGNLTGVWDVLAWKRGHIRFLDAKRAGRDRLRPKQIEFLEEIVFEHGGSIEMFRVVEWTIVGP